MEEWKTIEGYSNFQISNKGRLKSIAKTVDVGWGRKQSYEEKIIIGFRSSNGYLMVRIQEKKKANTFTIHSLVAKAFLGDRPKGFIVNHIDANKLNNNVENLEWTTYSGNIRHAYKLNMRHAPNEGKYDDKHPRAKAVLQFDLSGELVRRWNSQSEAARQLNTKQNKIHYACNGLGASNYQAIGFIWKYASDGR